MARRVRTALLRQAGGFLCLLSLLDGFAASLYAQDTFSPGYITVEDEGTALTKRRKLNFVGAGVACADDSGNGETDCTIGGGGSGNSFETLSVPAGTNPVADSSTDTLTITETSPLVITGTAATDTVDITWSSVDLGADGTIQANAVALTTDTTGNYVASVATTAPVTGGAAGSEGAALTIALTQNAGTDVTVDLEEETHAAEHASAGGDAVDHDALTNFVANEHIDHTAVTLTAGAGLSGGGDLSANRTFATDSSEAAFLAAGALTCGAGTAGKAQVHTTPLQYCDNAATPALQYAAYGSSTGVATSATALAANGGNCSAGNAPLGVDASGAVESCTDFEEDLANSAGLLAALSDETGTGVAVFGTSPTIATPALTGAYDLNNVAVDDDDCTGQQGQGWYDSTDSAWEFCNANSGAPATLTAAAGDITDVFNCASGDCASIAVTDGDLLDFTNVNNSTTTEGIILPQGTAPTGGTAEGQIAWETDVDELLVGTGSAQIRVGAFLLTTGWNASRTTDFNITWGGDSGNDEGGIVPAMTCRNLRAQVDVAPGVGNSWVVTLRDDGATTLLTCTMSNTTSCSNTSDVVSIAANSIIDSFWDANTTVTATAGQSAVMECYLD